MSVNSTAPLTNSPIRPRDVEFSTREYESSHGKLPRGFGSWAFVPYEFSRSDNYLDHVVWATGTYAVAKRTAAHIFAVKGYTDIVVCS